MIGDRVHLTIRRDIARADTSIQQRETTDLPFQIPSFVYSCGRPNGDIK